MAHRRKIFIRLNLDKEVAARLGLAYKSVNIVLDTALRILRDRLCSGEAVSVFPLGNLQPKLFKERMSRCPRVALSVKRQLKAGEITKDQALAILDESQVLVPAHYRCTFKPAKMVKLKLRELPVKTV